jgi:hypothetical protein
MNPTNTDQRKAPCESFEATPGAEAYCLNCGFQHAALSAHAGVSEAAQRQLVRVSSIDVEKMIAACFPGGSVCDPQQVADEIRRYCNAWPDPCAQPKAQAQAAREIRIKDELYSVRFLEDGTSEVIWLRALTPSPTAREPAQALPQGGEHD